MSNVTERTSSNVFYKARCNAAAHNEALRSREGAADIMSVDRGRLYRIERGIAAPYPEEVRMMADLYGAPELENYYCTNMCPLGRGMPMAAIENLDRLSVRALSAFRRMDGAGELLLDIAEDGMVDESEAEGMRRILSDLDRLEMVAKSLKLWARKNL